MTGRPAVTLATTNNCELSLAHSDGPYDGQQTNLPVCSIAFAGRELSTVRPA